LFKKTSFIYTFFVFVFLALGLGFSSYSVADTEGIITQVKLLSNKNTYDLSYNIMVVEESKEDNSVYKALGDFANGKAVPMNKYEFDPNKNTGYWFLVRIGNYDPLRENWILDLGRNVSNSFGVSNLFYIYSSDNFEEKLVVDGRYINAKKQAEGQKLNAIPLTIKSHTTQTFAFYIEPMRGMDFRISPKLVSENVYNGLEKDYLKTTVTLVALMVVLLSVSAFFYIKWRNPAFIILSIYTVLCAVVYSISDEIIPYGNNTGAVLIDVITVIKYIVAIALTYRVLSVFRIGQRVLTRPVILAAFFMMIGVWIGSLDYSLNQYSSLIIFGYLAYIIPLLLIFKSIAAFVKTIKANSSLLFGVAWLIIFIEEAFLRTSSNSMVASETNLYLVMQFAHIIALYISTILITDFKNKTVSSHLKQQQLRRQAEDEIKRTYEIVNRNHLLEVVQRERDLLLELKRHDSEIMQEEREEKDAKLKFLAMMSHEIRTPMTGIMGLINLLQGTSLSDKQREYIETLHQTGNALLLMLNDILDLSKAESGKMQIEYIDINIRDVVRHVSNIMEPFAHEKGVALNVGIAESIPKILIGDPTRISQILTNLVSNAIKFTSEGGYVNMIINYDKKNDDGTHNIFFIIEDTGIGIPQDMQEHLFQPYVQAGKSIARKFGGTGLGLAICYQLVNSMGGKIGLNSIEGKGSTFYFNLPMHEGEEPEVEENSAEAESDKKDKINILLVDDNDANRKIMALQMKQHLGKKAGELMTAANGIETINLMEKHKFDIVFMDLEMPDFSGIDVTGMIRKMGDKEKARVPIIAMTAHKEREIISECIQSGMNDFIEKPLNLDKLSKIINNIANRDEIASGQLGAALGEIRNERVPEMTDEEKKKHKIRIGNSDTLEISVPEDNINENVLGGIRKSLPIDEFKNLLNDLYESLEKEISSLEKATDRKDITAIKFHTHSIYGAAENFGFDAVGYMARKVNKHANNNDEIEIIAKYVQELGQIYKETHQDAEIFTEESLNK